MTDADKPRFREAFSHLAVALREKEPDVVTMRVYFDGLRELEIEFVLEAATRLVGAAWFPKVAEWRAAAMLIEQERRRAFREVLRKLPEHLCDRCHDTGWVETGPGTTAKGYQAPRRAEPCPCQAQRRLELLGRQPWPALPEGTRDIADRPFTRGESRAMVASYERASGRRLLKEMPRARAEQEARPPVLRSDQ